MKNMKNSHNKGKPKVLRKIINMKKKKLQMAGRTQTSSMGTRRRKKRKMPDSWKMLLNITNQVLSHKLL